MSWDDITLCPNCGSFKIKATKDPFDNYYYHCMCDNCNYDFDEPINKRELFKHNIYMNIAKEIAKLSHAKRSKVGAILVKDQRIIAEGYNGTPHGFNNNCELEPDTTKPEVLHAESNAITKIARSTNSSEGSSLYVTMSPCFECAKLIIQAGIKEVFYNEEYRNIEGLDLLKKANIRIIKI